MLRLDSEGAWEGLEPDPRDDFRIVDNSRRRDGAPGPRLGDWDDSAVVLAESLREVSVLSASD